MTPRSRSGTLEIHRFSEAYHALTIPSTFRKARGRFIAQFVRHARRFRELCKPFSRGFTQRQHWFQTSYAVLCKLRKPYFRHCDRGNIVSRNGPAGGTPPGVPTASCTQNQRSNSPSRLLKNVEIGHFPNATRARVGRRISISAGFTLDCIRVRSYRERR